MKKALTLVVLIVAPTMAFAQGTFQNLNFERANLAAYSPGGVWGPATSVPVSDGLPSWSAYFSSPTHGTSQLNQVWYDGISLGGAAISVIDSNAASYWYPIQGFIQRKYGAVLFGGARFSTVNDASSIISQTGLVPSGTMSLQAKMSWGLSAPVITLGGQTVSMVPLETFPSYTLYGGDVSSFAGQVETLSITEPPAPYGQVPPSYVLLDDIVFSPQVVPEPSVFALSALGAWLVGWRLMRRWG